MLFIMEIKKVPSKQTCFMEIKCLLHVKMKKNFENYNS